MTHSPFMSRAGAGGKRVVSLLACLACLAAADITQAQTRPALVRSVDEPARVPYGGTMVPNCGFSNQCTATFPAVPAGKRLRVTAAAAFVRSNTSSGSHLFALHRNDVSGANGVFLMMLPPLPAAYYGAVASTNQNVDVIYEAGEVPILELGLSAGLGGITASSARLTLTGYLVDVAP